VELPLIIYISTQLRLKLTRGIKLVDKSNMLDMIEQLFLSHLQSKDRTLNALLFNNVTVLTGIQNEKNSRYQRYKSLTLNNLFCYLLSIITFPFHFRNLDMRNVYNNLLMSHFINWNFSPVGGRPPPGPPVFPAPIPAISPASTVIPSTR
jgi:hypothetical protein